MITRKQLIEFKEIHGTIYIRNRKLARELKTRELRTKKNNFAAVAYGELDDIIVIYPNGTVQQLLWGEYEAWV